MSSDAAQGTLSAVIKTKRNRKLDQCGRTRAALCNRISASTFREIIARSERESKVTLASTVIYATDSLSSQCKEKP